MKNIHWVLLFALLSCFVLVFIWSNSFKSIPESSAQSQPVVETLRPVLDPETKMTPLGFDDYVRNLAHGAEFFLLGLLVGGFGTFLGKELKKRLISLPVLIVLAAAVGDEYIQHFSKRGSLVTDVMLDFAGALAGLLLFVISYQMIVKLKTK